MLVPFPLRYRTSLSRAYGSRAHIEVPPCPVLYGGSSQALDGDPPSWSPEYMLLSSLGLSLLTTFEAFAARDGIEILAWEATVGGTVDRTPDGLMFTSIVVELDVALAGDAARVEAALEDARQSCLVLNSLRVPVVIEIELRMRDEQDRLLPGPPAPRIRPLPAREPAHDAIG
jgi:organic hydroperoxide reductase OsmC/OhrA